jgi:membrane-associated protein
VLGLIHALGPSWLDPDSLVSNGGLLAILAIVFAECGLLIGFFLPGDSLLFTAGLLVADDVVEHPLWLVCILISLAAIAGNQVGYHIGAKAGPAVFNRPNSRLFKHEYVEKTSEFFDRYGGPAIVLARFVPIVRTFITVMAGASGMDYRKYTIFTCVGAVLWGTGVTVLGYFLGQVDFVRNNIEVMLLAIVAISVLPIAIELLRQWLRGRRASAGLTGDS